MKKFCLALILFYIPVLTALNNSDQMRDEHKEAIANHYIRSGDLVVDVGANVGNYTFPYSALVGREGLVVAYEANPYVFKRLNKKINWWTTSRGIANVSSKQKAASSSSDEKLSMKVYAKDSVLGSGTVEPHLWHEGRMPGKGEIVQVETEKLDELLKEYPSRPITFIKIDVEGHEHAVLEGARQILTLHRPLVIFEYGFIRGEFEPNTISQMEQLGYACFDLRNDEQVRPGYEVGCTDLFAVPVERLEEFMKVLPTLYYSR